MAGTEFGPGLPVLSTWLHLSARTQWESQKARPKQLWPMAQGVTVFIQGLSQKTFQIFHGEIYFQTSVQDQSTQSYVSLFAQSVPELLSASFSKNHSDSGFGLSLKEWPESRLYRKLSCASLHQGLNQINLPWEGAAPMVQEMPCVLFRPSPQDGGTSSPRCEQCWR